MDHDGPSLSIALDATSETPLYRQIADQIIARIQARLLPVGTRLPPSRALAATLDTHRNTVVRAFEILVEEGWISGHVGRGSFVATRAPAPAPLPARMGVAEPRATYSRGSFATADAGGGQPWQALMSRAVNTEPLRRARRLGTQAPSDAINLARMQPSSDLIPHEAFRRCVDHVLRTQGAEALGYAPSQGVERLRVLIAEDLERSNVFATPDDILVTTGSQQALDVVARTLVNPGDVFLTEGPTYAGALSILCASGADVIGIPSDEDGPDFAALGRAATRRPKGFYVMPNCRNPTGASMTAARRAELVRWSNEAQVPLVEDDYDSDLVFEEGAFLPPLRSMSSEVLHLRTYSKKLIPALRVGFVVCPPALRGPMTSLKHAMDLGTSALLQHALAEFLARGLMRAHIAEVCAAYRARRDALVEALARALPKAITFRVPDRGVIVWLEIPPGLDPEHVDQEARHEGVLVSPGSADTGGATGPNGLRLTYCAEPPERLAEGAKRLGRALHRALQHAGRSDGPASVDLAGA